MRPVCCSYLCAHYIRSLRRAQSNEWPNTDVFNRINSAFIKDVEGRGVQKIECTRLNDLFAFVPDALNRSIRGLAMNVAR